MKRVSMSKTCLNWMNHNDEMIIDQNSEAPPKLTGRFGSDLTTTKDHHTNDDKDNDTKSLMHHKRNKVVDVDNQIPDQFNSEGNATV